MDDIRLLRVFLEVIETGTMADAAATLDCTAAAISQQIGRLERSFEVKLLNRHSLGITPTEAGLVLAEHSRRILGSIIEMERSVAEAKDPTLMSLRLSAFNSATACLLPPMISDFRKRFPQIHLYMVEQDWRTPFDVLTDGDADIVVTFECDFVPIEIPDHIKCDVIGDDPFRALLPKTSPLVNHKRVSLKMLADEDFVFYSSRFLETMMLYRAASAEGFVPRISSEVNDYQVLPGMVSAGLGVSLASDLMMAGVKKPGVVIRSLAGATLKRRILMATRKESNFPFEKMIYQSLIDSLSAVVNGK